VGPVRRDPQGRAVAESHRRPAGDRGCVAVAADKRSDQTLAVDVRVGNRFSGEQLTLIVAADEQLAA
jgi:hypothetical protein